MPAAPDVTGSAADFLPARISLASMRAAAQVCRGCDLYRNATQAVFGEGKKTAPLMLIGEQPGNDEDLAGHPFVGPAGRILDQGLAEAGIDRAAAYVTNTVKHFKWTPSGNRRLHVKPNAREVRACVPWLEQEIAVVKPRVIVCLGATAAQALLGSAFRITAQRGQVLSIAAAERVMATVHPSSILRQRGSEDRAREMRAFVADLAKVAKLLAE